MCGSFPSCLDRDSLHSQRVVVHASTISRHWCECKSFTNLSDSPGAALSIAKASSLEARRTSQPTASDQIPIQKCPSQHRSFRRLMYWTILPPASLVPANAHRQRVSPQMDMRVSIDGGSSVQMDTSASIYEAVLTRNRKCTSNGKSSLGGVSINGCPCTCGIRGWIGLRVLGF